MSDHDFEKQVKARMEQLKLRPSDAVWEEVEKNIRRDKHRRRMILWLPLLLLILGAGGYYAMKETSRPAPQHLVQQTVPSTSSTPNSTPSTPSSTHTEATTGSKTTQQQNTNKTIPDQPTTVTDPAPADQPVANHQPVVKATVPATVTKSANAPSSGISTNSPGKNILSARHKKQGVKGPKKYKQQSAAAPLLAKHKPVTPAKEPIVDKDPTAETVAANNPTQPVQDSAAMTNTAADSSLTQVMTVDSLAKDTVQALAAIPVEEAPKTRKPKPLAKKEGASKWQFGVQAEGGYSGVTEDGLFGFLKSGNSPVADLASPNFSNAITMAPQFPRPVNKASSLTMGPAFSIGGFVQRTLSKRISLSAGIQYTYLSARQVVGSKVNNNRTVNRAPSTSQLVTEYYDANNTHEYTNRYHFIELPITLHTQLNKGKRLPITWDAGFSISKLLNTNALHYDGLGGVYYKDNTLFNKTQWVASTGFNVKLFAQSNHPLSIGPVMRYNISPLLQKEYSTGQHLWSVGLRASVLLKK